MKGRIDFMLQIKGSDVLKEFSVKDALENIDKDIEIIDFNREFVDLINERLDEIDSKYINGEMGPIVMTGNNLDFALNKPDTFFKIQNQNGDIVYTRDGAFKNLDGFLVDSNGNNVLNQDNEPIVIEDGFTAQIGVTKIAYTNLDKIGNNTYLPKNPNELEVFENNDNMIVQGAVESSNVNC